MIETTANKTLGKYIFFSLLKGDVNIYSSKFCSFGFQYNTSRQIDLGLHFFFLEILKIVVAEILTHNLLIFADLLFLIFFQYLQTLPIFLILRVAVFE